MQQKLRIVPLIVCLYLTPLAAQDATAVWNSLLEPTFDAEKSAHINQVTLVRDRIRITLMDGVIQFTQPLEGVVFGAAFKGNGRLQVAPPNTL